MFRQVLEGKDIYMEFAGNLVPILQSDDQPKLGFKAFKENRCAFNVRIKEPVSENYLCKKKQFF